MTDDSTEEIEDPADHALAYALCADQEEPSNIAQYVGRAKRLRELLRSQGYDVLRRSVVHLAEADRLP